MKIRINNFGKIRSVSIDNLGISVIAGINNTGKSTLGKIVFAIFDSLNNVADKIEEEKRKGIRSICEKAIRNYLSHNIDKKDSASLVHRLSRMTVNRITGRIFEKIDEGVNFEVIKEIVRDSLLSRMIECNDDFLEDITDYIYRKTVEISYLPDNLIIREILTRNFDNIFYGQINNLNNLDEEATIEIEIRDKILKIVFQNNACTLYESDLIILNDAFYIDNPFIVDRIEDYYDENRIQSKILDRLSDYNYNDDGNLINSVIAKEKLSGIYSILDQVISGNINYDDGYTMHVDKFQKPIKLNNLSTGLKSFVLIKLLLEKGILKSNDILILDEPEIHLHPEWQELYAQIIVLLQNAFELNIFITTHSSNFLESIEYYSKKHGLYRKCGFYQAMLNDERSYYKDVTSEINEIYKQMVQPSIRLDKLNYEMEEENDQ